MGIFHSSWWRRFRSERLLEKFAPRDLKRKNFSSGCESHGVDHDFLLYFSSKTAKPQSLQNEFHQVLKKEVEFCFLRMNQNSNQMQKQLNYCIVSQSTSFILKGLKGYEQKRQRLSVPPGDCSCEVPLQLFLRLRGNLLKI